MMRSHTVLALAVVLAADAALAQTTTNAPTATATNGPPALTQEADEKAWSFSLSAYQYFIPDDRDYAQPTFTADRGWLHLEARYAYEALETGSAWIGYNLSVGDKLKLDFTPMVGGVFGDLTGVAPGYEATLSWWKLELYSEGEYMFDPGNTYDDFFYNWSTLTLSPVDWFRFGGVGQRTRAYESDSEVERGVTVGFSYRSWDLDVYVLSLGHKPTVALSLGWNF